MKSIVQRQRLIELVQENAESAQGALDLLYFLFPNDKEVKNIIFEFLLNPETPIDVLILGSKLIQFLDYTTDEDYEKLFRLFIVFKSIELDDSEAIYEILIIDRVETIIQLLSFADKSFINENEHIFDENFESIIIEYSKLIDYYKSKSKNELTLIYLALADQLKLMSIEANEMEEDTKNYDSKKEDELNEKMNLLSEELHILVFFLKSRKEEFEDELLAILKYEEEPNFVLIEFIVELFCYYKNDEIIDPLCDILNEYEDLKDFPLCDKIVFAFKSLQSDKIIEIADETLKFKENFSSVIIESLGAYPTEESENLLIKYLHKLKDKKLRTQIAYTLSDIFSMKGYNAVNEFAKKRNIDPDVFDLDSFAINLEEYYETEII
jgi:hypothetical protein